MVYKQKSNTSLRLKIYVFFLQRTLFQIISKKIHEMNQFLYSRARHTKPVLKAFFSFVVDLTTK